MAAANTDKLRKKKSLFQTTLNGGITNLDTVLTLNSASGLPLDTAVTIVINRVDANGTATPSAMEVLTGVVSGSTVTDLLRAKDATTAKSHANASVVEMVWDAQTWNDFVDAYLTEHNQDGTHKAVAISTPAHAATSKATPVDADEIPIVDSAASNVLKKLTWANIKAALKTYFNTLYKTIGDLKYADLNAPEGFLVNGKIVVSVASNNITVAIKGMDGNDPSASNPVYCRINGVVRTITAALSKTVNAGANTFNAGSAELATKEIDYFAYLGYNATDGVVLGFSRIPYATQYSDFSATATAETYCAISTITNAAATDYYNVIGRFAATLSAGAGYTWSVPTYTAVNLIQRPIYETRVLTWKPTITGFSGTPTITGGNYRIIGRNVFQGLMYITGTSNATTFTYTLPISASEMEQYPSRVVDSGVSVLGLAVFYTTTVSLYKTIAAGAFTASGVKECYVSYLYLI